MRILVTGGAGFIGSHFVTRVLAEHPEDEVVVFDALTYAGRRENLAHVETHARFSFIQGNICDPVAVMEAVKRVDAVVHFAAETHVDRSLSDATVFLRTNIEGTWNILEACRIQKKRLHHVSTDEVYGSLSIGETPFSEISRYDPQSPYSASKAASDHLVRVAWNSFQTPVTISHCSNNFGPRCFPEKFIPLAITRLIQGQKIPIYGDGMNVRDWIFVEDHCRGIDLILRQGRLGETYDLGGQSERANIEVAMILLTEFGVGMDHIEFVADRKGHDKRYAIDPKKARAELNWTPKTPFLHGLRKTIAWYMQNESWWRSKTTAAPGDDRRQVELSENREPRIVPLSSVVSGPAVVSPPGSRLGDLSV